MKSTHQVCRHWYICGFKSTNSKNVGWRNQTKLNMSNTTHPVKPDDENDMLLLILQLERIPTGLVHPETHAVIVHSPERRCKLVWLYLVEHKTRMGFDSKCQSFSRVEAKNNTLNWVREALNTKWLQNNGIQWQLCLL